MKILGIDPGTRRIGYGAVQKEGTDARLVTAGILKIIGVDDISALVEAKRGIDALFKKYKPDGLAIEKLYFATNQKTAIAVAQARGVILLSAAEHGVPVYEYAPNEVKLGITGYGFADKKAMLKMVKLILCEPELALIDDAIDALAIAIMGTRALTA